MYPQNAGCWLYRWANIFVSLQPKQWDKYLNLFQLKNRWEISHWFHSMLFIIENGFSSPYCYFMIIYSSFVSSFRWWFFLDDFRCFCCCCCCFPLYVDLFVTNARDEAIEVSTKRCCHFRNESQDIEWNMILILRTYNYSLAKYLLPCRIYTIVIISAAAKTKRGSSRICSNRFDMCKISFRWFCLKLNASSLQRKSHNFSSKLIRCCFIAEFIDELFIQWISNGEKATIDEYFEFMEMAII